MKFLLPIALIAIASSLAFSQVSACGFQPLKPLVPLGCRDLRPVCECDANAKNCKWKWICVPNK